jgi:hypothetical protein
MKLNPDIFINSTRTVVPINVVPLTAQVISTGSSAILQPSMVPQAARLIAPIVASPDVIGTPVVPISIAPCPINIGPSQESQKETETVERPEEKKDEGGKEDFDPTQVMEWKDGIGTLPGSDLKVRAKYKYFLFIVFWLV